MLATVAALAALAALAACEAGDRAADGGTCPTDATCSTQTPDGLDFVGAMAFDTLVDEGPLVTAVGGTQTIEIEDASTGAALALPFDAVALGSAGMAITKVDGANVTVTGVGSGANDLEIDAPDGTLYDRKAMVVRPIANIALLPSNNELLDGTPSLAYATTATQLGVRLTDVTDALVADESTTLAIANGTQTAWDTVSLAGATPGTQTLAITAGGASSTLDVVFVDHADAIAAIAPAPLVVDTLDTVCFQATTAAGAAIVGLAWTVAAADGVQVTAGAAGIFPNCAGVTPTAVGTLAVTATAGGLSATVTFDVVASAGHRVARAPMPMPTPTRTTAGERASLGR